MDSGAFFGSRFYTSANSTPSNRQANIIAPIAAIDHGDTTPTSSTIGLHQKLDLLISGSSEQKLAIENLKAENIALKEKLLSVHDEMKALREIQASTAVVSQNKIKLPLIVSVSSSFFTTAC